MKRGTKFVLFGLLGVGGLTILVCSGFIYLGYQGLKELPKAQASADAFLELLNRDKVTEAYQSSTAEFQSVVTPQQFQDLIAKYPAFKNQSSRNVSGIRLVQTGQGLRSTIQYSITNPSNTMALTMVLKNDGGLWKVERLNIP